MYRYAVYIEGWVYVEEPYVQAGSYQSPGNRESIPSLADLDQGIVKLNQFFSI